MLFCGLPCSARFPIPLAFQNTGVVAALAAMIVVAMATIYTVELLIAQATVTGMRDYGALSKAIGGYWYKVIPCPVITNPVLPKLLIKPVDS